MISLKSNKVFDYFTNLKLHIQIVVLIVTLVLGFVTAMYIHHRFDVKLEVSGDQYKRIMQQKDILADALPPPMYLIEAWQISLEMATIKARPLQEYIDKGNQLRKDFQDRYAFWNAGLSKDNPLREISTDSYQRGINLLNMRDNELIPAIKAGDKQRIDEILNNMRLAYDKHRVMVDVLVAQANADANKIESETAILNTNNDKVSLILISALLILLSLISVLILQSVYRTLGADPKELADLTYSLVKGNIYQTDVVVDIKNRNAAENIKSLQKTLDSLISSINYVTARHDEGSMDDIIYADQFHGAYADMADGINAMVAGHIEMNRKIIECIRRIGEGDLDAPLETFPGDKVNRPRCSRHF